MATKKAVVESDDLRDASLRVSKSTRDSLKAIAAVMGRPLYDITNQALDDYIAGVKLPKALGAMRSRK